MKNGCECDLPKRAIQIQSHKTGEYPVGGFSYPTHKQASQTNNNGTRPDWLCDARKFIHEHYLEPISLFDVASAAEVHPAHLARSYRRYYRITVGDYIRSLRLQFAAQKLAHSNDPILEIALSSGFYDQSHFTNEFKARTGLTPAVYRRTFRTI